MFLSSTIYHSMSYGSTHKYILRIIDHSMISIAIAGSYTPVVLSLMNDWRGYLIITMNLKLVTLGGVKLDETVYSVTIPTIDGEISVLPSHEPLVTVAKDGVITVRP